MEQPKPRAGYQGKGTFAYNAASVEIVRMSDDRWYVFDNGIDLGVDFKTLRAAKKWLAAQ